MSEVVTVRGFVASEVRMTLSAAGCPIAHFRLGSTERKFDRQRKEWADAETNWYSVSIFRALAQNATASLTKGERVIVTGKLRLRQWSKDDGRRGDRPGNRCGRYRARSELGNSTVSARSAIREKPGLTRRAGFAERAGASE